MVGDVGVGKSSLVQRFADDSFQTTHCSTIGVDFKIRTLLIDETKVKVSRLHTTVALRALSYRQSY